MKTPFTQVWISDRIKVFYFLFKKKQIHHKVVRSFQVTFISFRETLAAREVMALLAKTETVA